MEYIEKIFKKTGWISILEAIVFAILGAILIWKPEESVKAIAYILSGIFIVIGIFKIINYFASKGKYDFYNYDLVHGLLAITIGIVTICCSSTIISIFRVIVGIWIIYSSFMRMSLALKLKSLSLSVWIYSCLLSIVMFACGLYIVLNSGAIIVTIGTMLLIYSIIDIIEDVIFMKNVKEIF